MTSFFISLVSFFTLVYSPITGGTGNMSSFAGKKILLVNIATGSTNRAQLQQLETLCQQHKDSLAIIVFPSNSFGNEPRNNAQLQQYFADSVGAHYTVAALSNVTGTGISNVYSWLAQQSSNGTAPVSISKDYQKVLINKAGEIAGIFSSKVQPTDSLIQKAIAIP